ncbi:hypothetical protein L2E82_06331 [Cichorium intybus]|uniref:Uncharacterized protein n=1 Tax=Cichorium intybus TaxID=13427 RepID=A0ACB9HAU4_CICIN|nr:hypothetical protein L2E82_06331 [Cichorium intybus]
MKLDSIVMNVELQGGITFAQRINSKGVSLTRNHDEIDEIFGVLMFLRTDCREPETTEWYLRLKASMKEERYRSPLESQKLKTTYSHISKANAASGMGVNDECKLKFLELKKRNYRFIIFKIEDKTHQVVVDKLGRPNESYQDLQNCLPSNECRFAVYDFDFVTKENCQKSKIFFFAWSPDSAKIRSKMIYASSKDRFKRELDGIQLELQATDASEMTFDMVKARAV